MPTVYTEVEVDVGLEDFDDDDLIEELERRGRGFDFANETPTGLVTQIYEKRRLGQDFNQELNELIYIVTGKFL